eukprot:CAMPEP_0170392166 /NCGR_PEP_ID=MMETSP0117_2-20130122/20047_1 /TAXON_ID=400756 /ORGANISM="Durinskia baltica, Strain CSIRO CS-38" /LENGTH=190 /DNA_ID=CAMNT_0010648285 /DNA_START=35 /DNA_END=607 /DNA_ORIENTATION=+
MSSTAASSAITAAAAAAVAGALAAHYVALVLQGLVPVSRAAWEWSTTPQCRFAHGVCAETAETTGKVDAGTFCTPQCARLVDEPSSSLPVSCPSLDDPNNLWYSICSWTNGGPCANDMILGAELTCSLAPTPAPSSTSSTTLPPRNPAPQAGGATQASLWASVVTPLVALLWLRRSSMSLGSPILAAAGT